MTWLLLLSRKVQRLQKENGIREAEAIVRDPEDLLEAFRQTTVEAETTTEGKL